MVQGLAQLLQCIEVLEVVLSFIGSISNAHIKLTPGLQQETQQCKTIIFFNVAVMVVVQKEVF